MITNFENWFLDYEEDHQMWHLDLVRKPENNGWVNIAYGDRDVLSHFCDIVDMMGREFNIKFTTDQVIRLAECTPEMTVFYPTSVPEDELEEERHMAPIWSKERIESHIDWKNLAD